MPDAPFADGGFPTPSGKCEFYSAAMLADGHDPLPTYTPPYESVATNPELARKYPLAMISPPARNFLNSTFVNVKSLRGAEGEPHLDIHPDDSAQRGIADGEMVRIFNDRGSFVAKARVTPKARAGPGGRPVGVVEEARQRRQERQRSDQPAPDRHGPRANLLRHPGAG